MDPLHLRKLNSLTKYPSIPTYHKLGDKGALLEEHNVEFYPLRRERMPIATEKIDGTNARIIVLPNGRWLIGSREELLHANGDLIHNPTLGIVDALRDVATQLVTKLRQHVLVLDRNAILTFYFEVYGGTVGKAAKQYTGTRAVGCRMFDISTVIPDSQTFGQPLEAIARWRQNGGQRWVSESMLDTVARHANIQLTPRVEIETVPRTRTETYRWLTEMLPHTLAALDDGGGNRPEGIVLRSRDRSCIAKLRVEDYMRHLARTANNVKETARKSHR
jgi:hypothetical protein